MRHSQDTRLVYYFKHFQYSCVASAPAMKSASARESLMRTCASEAVLSACTACASATVPADKLKSPLLPHKLRRTHCCKLRAQACQHYATKAGFVKAEEHTQGNTNARPTKANSRAPLMKFTRCITYTSTVGPSRFSSGITDADTALAHAVSDSAFCASNGSCTPSLATACIIKSKSNTI